MGDRHYVILRIAGAQQSEKLKDIFDHKTLFGIQAGYYFWAPIIGPVGATIGYSNRTKEAHLYLNVGYEF